MKSAILLLISLSLIGCEIPVEPTIREVEATNKVLNQERRLREEKTQRYYPKVKEEWVKEVKRIRTMPPEWWASLDPITRHEMLNMVTRLEVEEQHARIADEVEAEMKKDKEAVGL